MTSPFKAVRVYATVDKTLPSFDNTKLVAINTCPKWGIIRYSHHKTFQGHGRAMALEAGGAAHEVFAAHRLYTLLGNGHPDDPTTIFGVGGRRLFGPERFAEMVGAIDLAEDARTQRNSFALTALYNSGFYDDPSDKRRTTTNIEEMCIAYMDKYDWTTQPPVVLRSGDEPPFIGIEVPIDVTIEFTLDSGEVKTYRFIGKADGVHWKDDKQDVIRVHENKTASRLGDAWDQSWETNHQPTGYIIALGAMLNRPIRDGLILGSALPLPRGYAINGLSRVPITREDHHFVEWFNWFYHTVQLHDMYVDDPLSAPQYTHSCNRYFRPCSFIPLCGTNPDEQQDMFDEMVIEEWSPLEDEGSAD